MSQGAHEPGGRDLVLLGGGHAQVEVLRRFARRPEPGVRLTLIAREPRSLYSGLLPAVIRGDCAVTQAAIDLAPLAARAGARLIVAEAVAIDLVVGRVVLADGAAVGFDMLSIDIGGEPRMPADAAGEGAIPVKPIGRFLDRLTRLDGTLPAGARLAVVGDGAGGTELALALAHRFARRACILLVGSAPAPLPEAPARARRVAAAALAAAAVEVRAGVRAGAMHDGRLALSDGTDEPVAAVIWATGVVGPALLAAAGLACDADGCVQVDAGLRSVSHPRVFAAGDCAAISGVARPKAGVWAVRAGPVLAMNLRRALRGQAPHPWRPQRRALAILGLGDGRAVAWRGVWSLAGRGAAGWKAWLDRRWVATYR
ncbi:MAG: FAD-dependent oxidoreductase [Proteobacteria bacterium]|nr:FAD-dependent oxidoreductase [Pseudomonadota bacterium]